MFHDYAPLVRFLCHGHFLPALVLRSPKSGRDSSVFSQFNIAGPFFPLLLQAINTFDVLLSREYVDAASWFCCVTFGCRTEHAQQRNLLRDPGLVRIKIFCTYPNRGWR